MCIHSDLARAVEITKLEDALMKLHTFTDATDLAGHTGQNEWDARQLFEFLEKIKKERGEYNE